MQHRVWLLDSSIYIFRAWFSMPDHWHTADGIPLNAVYGYARFLSDFIGRTQSSPWVAAAFDESLGSCFRNELSADYKASRELPDEMLAFQLNACRTLTELCGIPCYGGDRFEADDYLATLARLARQRQLPVTVITRDKDLGQLLVDADDHWWDFAADQTMNIDGFEQRFGVWPDQFADYLALVGDRVDDIPGVPGVGPKTAAALISNLGCLENIQENMDRIAQLPVRGAANLGEKLLEYWPQAMLSRRLAQLHSAIPDVEQLAEFRFSPQHAEQVASYLTSIGLGGPLVRRWQAMAKETTAQ